MLKFYLGVAIMSIIFAVTALFFSAHAIILASVFTSMAIVFVVIGFMKSGQKHRW